MPLSTLLAKINSVVAISDEDAAALSRVRLDERDVRAGEELVFVGDKPTRSFMLSQGHVCMYKITGPGRRQIVNLHVAGDMPDLHSLYAAQMDVSISAITASRVCYVAHEDIRMLCLTRPNLLKAFWRMSLIEAGIAREWIVNVGQRQGRGRLAHLICELYARLDAVGLVSDGACTFPIPQTDLADATGMTPVHVNRMLQELRRDGLVQLSRRKLTIPDWTRLAKIADFDPAYLQLVRPPQRMPH